MKFLAEKDRVVTRVRDKRGFEELNFWLSIKHSYCNQLSFLFLYFLFAHPSKKLLSSRTSSEGLLSHNEVEVLKCDFIAIAGSTLEHLLELISRHGLAELFGDAAQIVYINSA